MKDLVNTINKCSSNSDELEPYSRKRVVLNVSWTERPLFGILESYDDRFLVLLKKDGRIQTIRRKAVLGIDEQREAV